MNRGALRARAVAARLDPDFGLSALGVEIGSRWDGAGRDPGLFPAIAQAAMSAARLADGFMLNELVHRVVTGEVSPLRIGGTFSDLPLVFYDDGVFRIELLLWADCSTQIHDHGFGGAFSVLCGESLHTEFAFSDARRFGSAYSEGSLEVRAMGLMRAGDVARIDPAPAFVHSAIHLSRPCATVVARTNGNPGTTRPRNFYKPGVAISCEADEAAARLARATAILQRSSPDAARRTLREMAGSAPPETLFGVFLQFDWAGLDRADTRAIHAVLAMRDFGPGMIAALAETRRLRAGMALRESFGTGAERLLAVAAAVLGDAAAAERFAAGQGIVGPYAPAMEGADA